MIWDTGIHDRNLNLYFTEIGEYEIEYVPAEETIKKIYKIINEHLTPQECRIMKLRFMDGLVFSKVAQELGVSENAVYKQVRQALVKIRKNLSQNG